MQDIFYSYREDSAEDFDFQSQKLMKYFRESRKHYSFNYCGRISSVSRAPDECSAGGRGFDSRGRANTQGLKITKK